MRFLFAATLLLSPFAAMAAPIQYELPAETAQLASGPNSDTAIANCSGCHSADYIVTQPRGFPDPKAFWSAEVTKMKKAYGAPIADSDVPKIVEYLATTYGK